MKKFKILIPVYNDWDSLIKLLDEINRVIADIKNAEFDCMVVNDASTIKTPQIKVPQNIKKIENIANRRKNQHKHSFNGYSQHFKSGSYLAN